MIAGSKIRLELITEQNLAAYIRLESDLSNRGHLTSAEISSEQALKRQFRETGFWDSRGGRLLAVHRETGAIIGSLSFFRTVHYFSAFELGFITYDESDRRKGYMKEAVHLLTDYLFETRQITRLEIRFDRANEASKKIAESAGYQYEGTNRGVRRKGNALMNLELYSITVEEWANLKSGTA